MTISPTRSNTTAPSTSNDKPTFFSTWPAKCWRKCGLQPKRSPTRTSKPQLLGCKGATTTPCCASHGTQAPSDPKRGQLPPPKASTTAWAWATCSPWGVSKRICQPVSVGWRSPSQRWRMWKLTGTPWAGWRKRCNQARSKGAAFMSAGNTRCVLPTKVSMPKPCTHWRNSAGPKWFSQGAMVSARSP